MYCLSAEQAAALPLRAAAVDSSPSEVAKAIFFFFCVSMLDELVDLELEPLGRVDLGDRLDVALVLEARCRGSWRRSRPCCSRCGRAASWAPSSWSPLPRAWRRSPGSIASHLSLPLDACAYSSRRSRTYCADLRERRLQILRDERLDRQAVGQLGDQILRRPATACRSWSCGAVDALGSSAPATTLTDHDRGDAPAIVKPMALAPVLALFSFRGHQRHLRLSSVVCADQQAPEDHRRVVEDVAGVDDAARDVLKWVAIEIALAIGASDGGRTRTSAPKRNSPKPMKKATSAATIWLRVNDEAMRPMADVGAAHQQQRRCSRRRSRPCRAVRATATVMGNASVSSSSTAIRPSDGQELAEHHLPVGDRHGRAAARACLAPLLGEEAHGDERHDEEEQQRREPKKCRMSAWPSEEQLAEEQVPGGRDVDGRPRCRRSAS